jgi:hypothetical protein
VSEEGEGVQLRISDSLSCYKNWISDVSETNCSLLCYGSCVSSGQNTKGYADPRSASGRTCVRALFAVVYVSVLSQVLDCYVTCTV